MLLLYDCINTAVFVILAYFFLRVFLVPSKMTTSLKFSSLLLWIIAEIMIVNLFADIFLFKALCTIALTSIMSNILFESKLIKNALLSFLEYSLYASFELMIYLILVKHYSYIYIYDLDDSIMSVFCGTISELSFFITIMIIRFVFTGREPTSVNTKELIKFMVFPVISLSMILVVGYNSFDRPLVPEEIMTYTYLGAVLLAVNIYIYWILRIDVENKLLRQKNQMFEVYASDMNDMYDQIREEQRQIAGIEHEYNNHLIVIDRLANSGNIDELVKYLKDQRISQAGKDVIDTGNDIASAIINAKYAQASRKGIQFRFDIGNLNAIGIRGTDLTIILSNLFNNAIEACERCDKEKIISVKILRTDDMIFICVANTCSEDNILNGRNIDTTKADKKRHGFGLSNIKSIVDEYDGQMDIIPEDGRFSVRIVIPMSC